MFTKPRDRKIAVMLAFAGAIAPISGLHKFYLRQPLWGLTYLLLSWTPIPRVASALEGLWYLSQDAQEFDQKFNGGLPAAPMPISSVDAAAIRSIADAVRHLDQLRSEGLISEYEFEQKRRQLLDQIA